MMNFHGILFGARSEDCMHMQILMGGAYGVSGGPRGHAQGWVYENTSNHFKCMLNFYGILFGT